VCAPRKHILIGSLWSSWGKHLRPLPGASHTRGGLRRYDTRARPFTRSKGRLRATVLIQRARDECCEMWGKFLTDSASQLTTSPSDAPCFFLFVHPGV